MPSSLIKLVKGKPQPFRLEQLLVGIAIVVVLKMVQGGTVGRIKTSARVPVILEFCALSLEQHFNHLWGHLHHLIRSLDWHGLG